MIVSPMMPHAMPVLRMDDEHHRAFYGDRELVRVTTALQDAGLVDTTWFTDESRLRGAYLHDAVLMHHEGDLDSRSIDAVLAPYWTGYLAFLDESGFSTLAAERAICDPLKGYAGRYDLFGAFPALPGDSFDLIDVKTGKAPVWVRLQTALYRRTLTDYGRVRRWVLELPGDGRYKLSSLNVVPGTHVIDRAADIRDESVGLAAVTVANFKRGFIR